MNHKLLALVAACVALPALAQQGNPYQCSWGNASQCDLAYAYSCSQGDQAACDQYNKSYALPGREMSPGTPFDPGFADKQAAAERNAQSQAFADKQKEAESLTNTEEFAAKTAEMQGQIADTQTDAGDSCGIILCMSSFGSSPKECRKHIKSFESIRRYNHHGFSGSRTKTARAKKLYSCDSGRENKPIVDGIIEAWGAMPYIVGGWKFY